MASCNKGRGGQRWRGGRGGHGRTRKQACLTNKSNVIERALRIICLDGGTISLEDLTKKVGKFDPDLGGLEDIISNLHDRNHFLITDNEDGGVTVEAHTDVKLCPSYQKGECTEGDSCQCLHLCGYFATGSCCWFGQNCRKSHYFRSDHNKQVLKDFKIAFLSQEHLNSLFRWMWPQFTVPDFCGQYRSKKGCQKQHCRFLHLCKNNVMDHCRFGIRCKFAHDIYQEPSNKRLLERFKLNLEYSSEDLIRLIKERHEGLYRPDVEVLESGGDETDEEESEDEESEESEDKESKEENNYLPLTSLSRTELVTSPKKVDYLQITRNQEPKSSGRMTAATPSTHDSSTSVGTTGLPQDMVSSPITKLMDIKFEEYPYGSRLRKALPLAKIDSRKMDSGEKKITHMFSALSTDDSTGTKTNLQKKLKDEPSSRKSVSTNVEQTPAASGETKHSSVKPTTPSKLNPSPSPKVAPATVSASGAESTVQAKPTSSPTTLQTAAMHFKLEEICKENLQGRCTSGGLCQRFHCTLPYQWQRMINGKWLDVIDDVTNSFIEKRFCELVSNTQINGIISSWNASFGGMIAYDSTGLNIYEIRRLEVKGESDISDAYLISHWSWYWQDECGKWIEYSEQNTKQNAQSDKESSDFETLYQAFKNGNGSSTVQFKAGTQQYTLNFDTMTQTNDKYGTRKDVCRRPARCVTLADVKKYREDKPWLQSNTYPRTWDTSIPTTSSHRLVKVPKHGNNDEYNQIKKLLKTTLPGATITCLERVQNEICWETFARQREVMMRKNSGRLVDERQLFHGTTKEKVDDICRDNFDFRLSGTRVGHIYGQGAYFASTSKYSDDYADEDSRMVKRMFVARVLVGSYVAGTADMRRPPFKNPTDKSKGMYNSCVDDASNPSIFVVFDNNQVYPEYLISYMYSRPSSITNQYVSNATSNASSSAYRAGINSTSASSNNPTSSRLTSPSSANQPYVPNRYRSPSPTVSRSTASSFTANQAPYGSHSPPTTRRSSNSSPGSSSARKKTNSSCICM